MCAKLDKVRENIQGVNNFIVKVEKLQELLNTIKEPSLLEMLWDTLPALVFYKDTNNRLIRVNQTFADMCGLKKEDIEGKSVEEFANKNLARKYAQNDYDVMSSKKPKLGIVEPLSFNSDIILRTDKYPIIVNDEVIGVLGISVKLQS